METFAFASAVRGYHVYKDVWETLIGKKLVAKREFNNPIDKHCESSEGQRNGRPFAS